MSRRFARLPAEQPTSFNPRDNDPEPEPEPPIAPPVIILAKNSPGRTIQEPRSGALHVDPALATQPPHTSPPLRTTGAKSNNRYNLRKRESDPDPTPDPVPEPDPAPPIIILSKKRAASASPPQSTPPSASTPATIATTASPTTTSPNSAQPKDTIAMGAKASKVSSAAHGKLQPSINKSDKAEMKEPSNYYSHRSKSMRRKAGKAAGGAPGGGPPNGGAANGPM